MDSNGKNRKSILTDKPVIFQTPPSNWYDTIAWRVDDFEDLIQNQGYDAYIDRALRCPCVDKTNGQALSTCKNCLGRGWIFVNRTQTRLIAQHMDSKKKYENWGEVNKGTASITTKGSDELGFMDRIILLQTEESYSEILNPITFDSELLAYPIYEPLEITNIYLFGNDQSKLIPLTTSQYTVDKNKIIFDPTIKDLVDVVDVNQTEPIISITIRYKHYPVYHVIESNRELMKVRQSKFCNYDDENLRQMPINVLARKAHYIFDNQRFGYESLENSVEQ